MPTYVYACKSCEHRFEQYQSFSEDSLLTCPECAQDALRKVFNSVGIVFKGPGFYSTDSASTGSSTPSGASSSESAESSGSSESSGTSSEGGGESAGSGSSSSSEPAASSSSSAPAAAAAS